MELPHTTQELIQYAFYAVASLIGITGVGVLRGMLKSIEALNVKVGVLLERTNWHDKEIKRLDRQKADKRNK